MMIFFSPHFLANFISCSFRQQQQQKYKYIIHLMNTCLYQTISTCACMKIYRFFNSLKFYYNQIKHHVFSRPESRVFQMHASSRRILFLAHSGASPPRLRNNYYTQGGCFYAIFFPKTCEVFARPISQSPRLFVLQQ